VSATAIIPAGVIAAIPMVGLEPERNAWNVAIVAPPGHLPITIVALLTGATRISRKESKLPVPRD
jgi:hypothetical protein